MYFKLKSICLCICCCIWAALTPPAMSAAAPPPPAPLLQETERITIDRIAAVVNDKIITLTDIDKALQFFPVLRKKGESEQELYNRVLQDLVNYKVVYLEYRDEFTLAEEDYTDVQTSIIKKVGSYGELMALLRKFDMQWQDFNAFIREKGVYDKVMNVWRTITKYFNLLKRVFSTIKSN